MNATYYAAWAEYPCWVHAGLLNENGYGIGTREGRNAYVHRAAYQALIGPIPDGLHIDHRCRNRACYNPRHCEPVTPAENNRRSLTARNAYAKHGTSSKYQTGCRCDECRGASNADGRTRWSAASRERRERRLGQMRAHWSANREQMREYDTARRRAAGAQEFTPAQHGTRSMYVRGCRCEGCVTASREYARARYAARKQATDRDAA